MPDMEDGALGKESYDEVIMNTLISTSADVLGELVDACNIQRYFIQLACLRVHVALHEQPEMKG